MTGLKAIFRACISTGFILAIQWVAHAQINFSEETVELQALEDRVNICAEQQDISTCLNALSATHVLQISQNDGSLDPDHIMRDAVMLLPLFMLTELYNRDGKHELSCGFARSGERQLQKLLADIDRLIGRDPNAFRRIDSTRGELMAVQIRFDKALVKCG